MENLNCPYCKTILIEGNIIGDRYSIKWLPANKKLFLGIWVKGGEIISTPGFGFFRPKTICYKCENCKKIIIDLLEN